MPIIRPLSYLHENPDEIFRMCVKEEQPVYLTKNGQGKLVVMSQEYFEKMQAMSRLYSKLEEAQSSADTGDKGISHTEMMRRARAHLKKNDIVEIHRIIYGARDYRRLF